MYTPESPPRDFEDVWRELQNVQTAFLEGRADFVELKVWNAAPAKPRQGQTYYADGTNWDPGFGEGLYFYDGTTYYLAKDLVGTYTEGTWTPVLSDGTNNATSTTAVGTYTRIGRQVTVKARLVISSLGSVSGNLRVTGLPLTSSSATDTHSSIHFGSGTGLAIATGESISGVIAPNTSYIELNLWDAVSGVTSLQHAEWSGTGAGVFSGTYFV